MNLSRFFSSSDNLLGTMQDEELQFVGNFFENLVTETFSSSYLFRLRNNLKAYGEVLQVLALSLLIKDACNFSVFQANPDV